MCILTAVKGKIWLQIKDPNGDWGSQQPERERGQQTRVNVPLDGVDMILKVSEFGFSPLATKPRCYLTLVPSQPADPNRRGKNVIKTKMHPS